MDLERKADPKPIEAMQPCEDSLTTLPDDITERPVEEAVEILTTGHARDAAIYFECKLKQEDEARWIYRQ